MHCPRTLLALVLALAAPLARPAAQDAGSIAARILRSGEFQTELPAASGESPPKSHDGTGRPRRGPAERSSGGPALELRGGFGGLDVLLGIALGVVALVALIALILEVRNRGRDVVVRDRERDARPKPAPVAASDAALDAARGAWAEGRFADALRILLRGAFDALRGRGDVAVDDWLTARGVLRRARLPAPTGAALRDLVEAVERSAFAGRSPDARDLERCEAAFRTVAHDGRRSDA